ncbi:glycerophosphodiester phosphodiesterase [bacterium]|nr:glycerophosphodiester phosphodiesterase [bacterium]
MGHEPENTLRSFKKALDLDVDMVELDVHVCKSGELVVIHDETLDKNTNGTGLVADKMLTELKSLDAGQREKIPTLEEVLDLVNKQVPINIELKGKGTAQPVAEMIKQYVKVKGWDYDHFLISSFSNQELIDFYTLNKKVRLGVLNTDNGLDLADQINAFSVNFAKEVVTSELVEQVHQTGRKVLVYTVNEEDDIKRMRDMGVDGIFCNYPDRIS